jgi:hypothetical protein
MTTFKTFLSESKTTDDAERIKEILDKAFAKCQPYISANIDSLASGKNLIRTTGSDPDHTNYGIEKLKIRTDRLPRDTSKVVHDMADDFFFKKFGKRYRSSALFCQIPEKFKAYYGHNKFMIFPIGNYTLCFSPTIKDMSLSLDPSVGDPAVKKIALLSKAKISKLAAKDKEAAMRLLTRLIITFFINSTRYDRKSLETMPIDKFIGVYEEVSGSWSYVLHDAIVDFLEIDENDSKKAFKKPFMSVVERLGFKSIDEIFSYSKDIFTLLFENSDYRETQAIADVTGTSEVMVHGKEYYAIPINLKRHVVKYFKNMQSQ